MYPAIKATHLVVGAFAIAALIRASEGLAHERIGRATAVVCVDESVDGLAKDLVNEMRTYASESGQATDFATAYSIALWPPDSITATIAPTACHAIDSLIEHFRDSSADGWLQAAARTQDRTLVVVRANPSIFVVDPRLSTDHGRLRFVVDTARTSVEYFFIRN